ncbi:uncharacterized protein [Leptinotarsa decemlineata]|uniref:uncharacterized protein n=1 Tax=Leptinotarsa decemlineata TaxID=7539 RepID=UPI003D3075D0
MAVEKMVEQIRKNKREGWHSLVVALDLSNAFNSAWAPAIESSMKGMGVPGNVGELCMSFIGNREVMSGGLAETVDRGCPQGSSLGPTLWLIIMERWFERMREMNERENERVNEGVPYEQRVRADIVWAQAYADDQILIVGSAKSLEKKWSTVWKACTDWEDEAWVTYNHKKTECMFVAARKVERPPVVRMHGKVIDGKESIKYLGIVVDRGFLFIDHMKEVRRKMAIMAGRMRWTGRDLNVRRECVRIIYERVAKPIWGAIVNDSRIRRQILAAQRPFLLVISGAYKTTANAALAVLAGVAPLNIEAAARYQEWMENGREKNRARVTEKERVSPWNAGRVLEKCDNMTEVYVDASRTNDGRMSVGWAYKERNEWKQGGERVEGMKDINEVEMTAIERVIERSEIERPRVVSDSEVAVKIIQKARPNNKRAVSILKKAEDRQTRGKKTWVEWRKGHDTGNEGNARAHAECEKAVNDEEIGWTSEGLYDKKEEKRRMRENIREKWQREWDTSDKGRWTYEWCRMVGRERLGLNRKAVQLITGHGNFTGYLSRFGLGREVPCACGTGDLETAEHIIRECRLDERARWRERLREEVRERGEPQMRDINGINDEWVRFINEMAEHVVGDEGM